MASHRWDNSIRPRYIYLLAFYRSRVYVGQSLDPERRIKAHIRPSGGWPETFLPLVVQKIDGAEVAGVDLEYAWRWRACLSGWMPIDKNGIPFDTSDFRESARAQGALLPWPFTT